MDDTHPFDLLRREETKLDLLDRAQRRLRVWEENVRHDGTVCRVNQVVVPVGDSKKTANGFPQNVMSRVAKKEQKNFSDRIIR